MLRSLYKRLQKLESRLTAESDNGKQFGAHFALFLLDALGYYFGNPKLSEAPDAATARALGYQHEGELNEALQERTNSEFDEKYARANCKLFAKFGVDMETADGQGIAAAAKRIYAGLPVSYKARTRVKPLHDNSWSCRPLEVGPVGPMSRKSRVFTRDVQRHFDRAVNGPMSHGGVL